MPAMVLVDTTEAEKGDEGSCTGSPVPQVVYAIRERCLSEPTANRAESLSLADNPDPDHVGVMTDKKGSSILPPKTFVKPRAIGPVEDPNANDVLSGRGGRINSHKGNVQFRDIVQKKKPRYLSKATKKLEKAHIANEVVEKIRSMDPPGRFLSADRETGLWWDIGDVKARKKAGQAMREDATDYRQGLNDGAADEDSGGGGGSADTGGSRSADTEESRSADTGGSRSAETVGEEGVEESSGAEAPYKREGSQDKQELPSSPGLAKPQTSAVTSLFRRIPVVTPVKAKTNPAKRMEARTTVAADVATKLVSPVVDAADLASHQRTRKPALAYRPSPQLFSQAMSGRGFSRSGSGSANRGGRGGMHMGQEGVQYLQQLQSPYMADVTISGVSAADKLSDLGCPPHDVWHGVAPRSQLHNDCHQQQLQEQDFHTAQRLHGLHHQLRLQQAQSMKFPKKVRDIFQMPFRALNTAAHSASKTFSPTMVSSQHGAHRQPLIDEVFGKKFMPTSTTSNMSISNITSSVPTSSILSASSKTEWIPQGEGPTAAQAAEAEQYQEEMQQLRHEHYLQLGTGDGFPDKLKQSMSMDTGHGHHSNQLKISDITTYNSETRRSSHNQVSDLSLSLSMRSGFVALGRSFSLSTLPSDVMSLGENSQNVLFQELADGHDPDLVTFKMKTESGGGELSQPSSDQKPSPVVNVMGRNRSTSSSDRKSSTKSSCSSAISALSDAASVAQTTPFASAATKDFSRPLQGIPSDASIMMEESQPSSTSHRSSTFSWMRSMQSIASDMNPWSGDSSRASMFSSLSAESINSLSALDLAYSTILPPLPRSQQDSSDSLNMDTS